MTNSSVERIDTSGAGVKAFVKTAKGEEVLKQRSYFRLLEKTNIEKHWTEVGIATDKIKFW
jgi:dihydrolipoamide dehydrogenase